MYFIGSIDGCIKCANHSLYDQLRGGKSKCVSKGGGGTNSHI